MNRAVRCGFTLLELLIVVALVGILLAMTFGAVQRARMAALKIQCGNNLHQIGLAAHHFHDSLGSFPAGMRWNDGLDPHRLMAWHAQLLPYLDRTPLWKATVDAYQLERSPFRSPPHVGLSTVIPVFTCPADPRVGTVQHAPREGIRVALTSYLGVSGRDVHTLDGVLFRDSQIRISDITDGTSQTLFAGERPPSADFQFGWWYAGVGQRYTGSADSVLGVEEPNLLLVVRGSCAPGNYRFGPGRFDNQCDMFHFWSPHPGGAQFLFADASVRFIGYSSAGSLPALASRAGEEVVDGFN